MNQTALVTGATGFIGKALTTRLLGDGWDVSVITRAGGTHRAAGSHPRLSVYEYDGEIGTLIEALDKAQPTVVFHLASLFLVDHAPEDVAGLINSNLLFPAQLVEAMTATGISRLVNTGTSWQHFGTSAYRPVNLYAATKQAFEDLLAYYHDVRGLSILNLKLFDTYGPRDPRRKLLRILLEASERGERLDMSPGEQVIDLTHVEDVVDGFLLAASALEGSQAALFRTCFLSAERLTLQALVRLVQESTQRPLDVRFGGRPYREREVLEPIAPDVAQLLPGWRPKRSLASWLSSPEAEN